jgi:hypothetical protein
MSLVAVVLNGFANNIIADLLVLLVGAPLGSQTTNYAKKKRWALISRESGILGIPRAVSATLSLITSIGFGFGL